MRSFSNCLPCVLVIAACASSADAATEQQPGALWPDHQRVVCVEVANGPAWQFNALASVELPADLGADPAEARSMRLIELDDAGRPGPRWPIQVDRGGQEPRLWLPLGGATRPGAKRRFLLFADGPKAVPIEHDQQAPTERSFDTLGVETANAQIRIGNQYFRTTQPERGNGGFPTSVTFAHSGLTTKQFYYEDRIYDGNTKVGYGLKHDSKATASVVARGPLRTVIKVEAHYARGESHTKGNARAVYHYEFRAGSPLVAVTADVKQDEAEPWTELHFLQLSTQGMKFPLWRAGQNRSGRFTGSKKSHTVKHWGVMGDGIDAIGLFTAGNLVAYDDPAGYCNYFQFPVVGWNTETHRFAGWIYIGPFQSHAVMDRWSARLAHPPKATLRPLPALQALRAKLAQLPDEPTGAIEARYERALYLRLLARDPATIQQADLEAVPALTRAFADPKFDVRTECGPKQGPGNVTLRRVGDSLWLANAFAAFHLDLSRGGRITQVLNLTHGRDFIGPGAAQDTPLWRLKLRRKDGKTVTVDSRTAGRPNTDKGRGRAGVRGPKDDAEHGEVNIKVEWPGCRVPDCQGTLRVSAELKIRSDRPMVYARLAIENQLTDAGLWTVEFPVIAPLGPRGQIDVAVPRGNWGILSRALAGGTGGSYPSGNWPMQYVSVTSGPSTLYLADHHPQCGHKRFALKAGGEFKFQIYPPDMGKPGTDFVMDHDVAFGPVDGDWFDAARVYRDWAHQQIWMSRGPLHQRHDMPGKLRDGLVWVLLSGGPEQVVPKVIAAQEFLGVPVGVHWYNWHKIPFDDDYPHYFPTKDGVSQAVKTLTDRGVYVMPYINGRLWDSDTKDFKTVALPAATKDVNGKPYVEVYGSGQKLVPMCPTTKVWRDKVCQIIDRLVNEVGVNAVYLDQIAAAGPRQCFDASHGHPLGGGAWWCPPYWQMMDRIQKIGAAKGPDVFFTTENNAESYSHNIDAFLVWNPRRPEMIPINAVVYADMRVHFANRVHPNDSDMAFAMKVGRDFLWGTQLGWMAPFYLEPAHRAKGTYFRRLAKARMRANKFLAYGQMLRPPMIRCDDDVSAEWFGQSKVDHTVTWPAVGGACWRAPDGRVGLIFTNYDTSPREFTFTSSDEAGKQIGQSPLWCELSETGLRQASIKPKPDGSYHVASLSGRSVLVLEVIPCASAAEMRQRQKDLPAPAPKPKRPAPKPSRLQANLDLPSGPTPAGESVPATLTIQGTRPAGTDWCVRLNLPDGYAVEPAPLILLEPGSTSERRIDLMICPPPKAAAGDHPVDVELLRRLGAQNLRLAPPRK